MITQQELLESLRAFDRNDKTRNAALVELAKTIFTHYIRDKSEKEQHLESQEEKDLRKSLEKARATNNLIDLKLHLTRNLFFYAAEHGYCEVLKYIEELPSKPVNKSIPGLEPKYLKQSLKTALYLSAKSKKSEAPEYLLNIDPSQKEQLMSDNDYLLFSYCARVGNAEAMKLFLREFPDQAQKDDIIHSNMDQAIIDAVREGYLEIVELLIAETPDPDKRYEMIHIHSHTQFINHRCVPIAEAARGGHIKILKLLIEHSDQNIRQDIVHESYLGALQGLDAGRNGCLEIVALLLTDKAFNSEQFDALLLDDEDNINNLYDTEKARIFVAIAFDKYSERNPLSEKEEQKVESFKKLQAALAHHYENGVMPPQVVAEFLEEKTASKLESLKNYLIAFESLQSTARGFDNSNSNSRGLSEALITERGQRLYEEIKSYFAPANINPLIFDDIVKHFENTIDEAKASKPNEMDAAGKRPSTAISNPELANTSNKKISGRDS